jgi:hypothetical protein
MPVRTNCNLLPFKFLLICFLVSHTVGTSSPGLIVFSEKASSFKNLRSLDVGGNEINDEGITVFATRAFPDLAQLRMLSVDCNNIADIGMIALAQAIQTHPLSSFQFHANPFTSASSVAHLVVCHSISVSSASVHENC